MRVALRPKNLAVLALMLCAAVVSALLANWQWERAISAIEVKGENEVIQPVALAEVLELDSALTNQLQGRLVVLEGKIEADKYFISPNRQIDGKNAALIVVSFLNTDATKIPVALGWFESAADLTAFSQLDIESPKLRLVARLEAGEEATLSRSKTDVWLRETISPPLLVNEWGAPMYSAFAALTAEAKAQMAPEDLAELEKVLAEIESETGITIHEMPIAENSFSKGINFQNFGYMLQWILFAAFFIYIWWRKVRTEYLDELAENI